MEIHYFEDTDTLYIEFRDEGIVETRDLDENTLLELDERVQVRGITFEHASERTDVGRLSVEGLAAA